MAICKGCGASHSDNYKFCPYCGRLKSERTIVSAQGTVDPRNYEEATLRIRFTVEKQVLLSTKGWFGPSTIEGYVQVGCIELLALSHEKGEYIALTSGRVRGLPKLGSWEQIYNFIGWTENFRGWKETFEFVETGKPYDRNGFSSVVESIIQERKQTWEEFCTALRNDGWFGITDPAIARKNPFGSEAVSLEGEQSFQNRLQLNEKMRDWFKKSRKQVPNQVFNLGFDHERYRYRRQVEY